MKRTLRLAIQYDGFGETHITVDDQDGKVVGYFFDEQDGRLFAKVDALLTLAEHIAADPYALTPDQWATEARQILTG